jgi:hypothetical protein
VPEEPLDPPLARQLTQLLSDAASRQLSSDELADVKALPPPSFALTPENEGRALVLRWGGYETQWEWDGTEADALDTLASSAESILENLSGDYWYAGGWRTGSATGDSYTSE